MLQVEDRYMIKELHRKGLSISEIARQTGHDRKTIRRTLSEPLEVKQQRGVRGHKLDPYIGYLEGRMSEGVYNARKLFVEIQAQGYPGGETQVRTYVQQRRPPRNHPPATVRYETEPGQQAQVDWGSFGYVEMVGKRQRLYGFVMTLGWSRACYLEFTTSMETGWFLRCHQHAFDYLGGVPREVLHDNLKSAVLQRESSGQIVWNTRYLDFALSYGFQPRACRPYRPQTKGKVENGIRYVRGNFWPGLHFSSLTDLNAQALAWCNQIANCRVHGTTGEIPFERLPREQLAPVPPLQYDTSVVVLRQVSRDCLVSYAGNYYSVPAIYAGQPLLVKETEAGDLLAFNPLGELVAHHRLLSGRHQRSLIQAHYASLQSLAPAGDATLGLPLMILCGAPQVEVRPLSVYAAVAEAVAHD